MMSKFSKKAKEDAVDDSPDPFTLDGDPNTIIILDGDELAFKVAAACEERAVKVTNSISQQEVIFKNRTEFKKLLHPLEYEEEMFTFEDTQKAEPLKHAISTLKSRIKIIGDKCDAGSYEIYISGKDNFRDFLPLPEPYKGHRKDQVRPLLLKDLKNYLVEYKGAIVVDGKEADDAVTTRMYDGFKSKKKIVGCTQDKDATQTEGWYFNPERSKEPFLIKGYGKLWYDAKLKTEPVRGSGRIFLYYQLLIGDKVDHYCPRMFVKSLTGKTPRYGSKTCFTELTKCTNDKEALALIVKRYKGWFGEEAFEYTDHTGKLHKEFTWLDVLQCIADCAFMQRWEDDRFVAKDVLTKVGLL